MIDNRCCCRGLWKRAGVPQKGWLNIGMRDRRPVKKTCEMCETAEISVGHIMAHPDFPETLEVGVSCAEHMENDYVSPRRRERPLINRAARRRYFPRLKGWRTDPEGMHVLCARNFVVLVAIKDGFSLVLIRDEKNRPLHVEKIIGLSDLCELKKRAFDTLTAIETEKV